MKQQTKICDCYLNIGQCNCNTTNTKKIFIMSNTNELKNPKTSIQEVLYTIIKKGHVSIFDFPYLSGFRTRVSDLNLKYNLNLERITSVRNNKFGNSYTYAIHKIRDKEMAINLYHELTLNN